MGLGALCPRAPGSAAWLGTNARAARTHTHTGQLSACPFLSHVSWVGPLGLLKESANKHPWVWGCWVGTEKGGRGHRACWGSCEGTR